MEYREAIKIILQIQDKYLLSPAEKDALAEAVGTLDWFALGKNRVKQIVQKKLKQQHE